MGFATWLENSKRPTHAVRTQKLATFHFYGPDILGDTDFLSHHPLRKFFA
jgi:hypothetical protein